MLALLHCEIIVGMFSVAPVVSLRDSLLHCCSWVTGEKQEFLLDSSSQLPQVDGARKGKWQITPLRAEGGHSLSHWPWLPVGEFHCYYSLLNWEEDDGRDWNRSELAAPRRIEQPHYDSNRREQEEREQRESLHEKQWKQQMAEDIAAAAADFAVDIVAVVEQVRVIVSPATE